MGARTWLTRKVVVLMAAAVILALCAYALLLQLRTPAAKSAPTQGETPVGASRTVGELRMLAQAHMAEHQWGDARLVWQELLSLAPDDAEAHFYVGLLLMPDSAEQARHHLIEAAADAAYADPATQMLRTLDLYESASATNAYTRLGITLVTLEEWPLAERMLDRALDKNAINPLALAYLGYTRDRQGGDGLEDIERALAMSPNDPMIHYVLGLHWRHHDRADAALESFRRAYWLSPDNPALAVEVAISLQAIGDLPGAEQWYWVAVQLAPEEMRWQTVLGEFYADTGFGLERKGLAFLEDARQAFPQNASLGASVGWAYYRLDQLDRAYAELSAAVRLAPGDVRSRYYWGMVLESRGDVEGALDSYFYVRDTADPESVYSILAQRGLERLGYSVAE